ncbi:MAG: hypothetical protein HYR63_19940 [Proteobacteria bacterium]|nr:hypothetical protein [Pseudomonadota bacterium]
MNPNRQLAYVLSSGSARVFACHKITMEMSEPGANEGEALKSPADPTLFFQTKDLNHSYIIKEARDAREQDSVGAGIPAPLTTRIYFPFDANRPQAGGQSISLSVDTVQLLRELKEHVGLVDDLKNSATANDLKMLNALKSLPSLDPFLLKDKLIRDDLKVNERYLYIDDDEWEKIKSYVNSKFTELANFVYEREADKSKPAKLMEALWDMKDKKALENLGGALGLPPGESAELFYSWKGVIYYEHSFELLKANITQFSDWIVNGSIPTGPISKTDREACDKMRNQLKACLRQSLSFTLNFMKKYNLAYDNLFKLKKTAEGFVGFLKNAPNHFNVVGTNISTVNHCMSIWDRSTGIYRGRRVPTEDLLNLFGMFLQIFGR